MPGLPVARPGRRTAGRSGASFSAAAQALANAAGSAWASGVGIITVTALLTVGVVEDFPIWWQTVVNSAGALVSLLVLFSIQHITNRQARAILLKLDELIQVTGGAGEEIIAVEDRGLHEQEHLHYRHHQQQHVAGRGGTDRAHSRTRQSCRWS